TLRRAVATHYRRHVSRTYIPRFRSVRVYLTSHGTLLHKQLLFDAFPSHTASSNSQTGHTLDTLLALIITTVSKGYSLQLIFFVIFASGFPSALPRPIPYTPRSFEPYTIRSGRRLAGRPLPFCISIVPEYADRLGRYDLLAHRLDQLA
ncbi:hypothetical protein OIV57_34165, partial [Burkholderia pseudomallei]|uniref:hypothetical protein n=1 Tax=Burkholderia pseudomallei TaxID=28450 RepID=UPI0021F7B22F